MTRLPYGLTYPDWDFLFEMALSQEGYFTSKQAALAGHSSQLLLHHLHAGKIARIQRGIYRILNYPWTNHEHLMILWLWSNETGVFSHETALALHGLCEPSPLDVHLTLPLNWRRRRVRIPPRVVVHYADVPLDDRTGRHRVPITAPERTLNDCAQARLAPQLLVEALRRALARGLLPR